MILWRAWLNWPGLAWLSGPENKQSNSESTRARAIETSTPLSRQHQYISLQDTTRSLTYCSPQDTEQYVGSGNQQHCDDHQAVSHVRLPRGPS